VSYRNVHDPPLLCSPPSPSTTRLAARIEAEHVAELPQATALRRPRPRSRTFPCQNPDGRAWRLPCTYAGELSTRLASLFVMQLASALGMRQVAADARRWTTPTSGAQAWPKMRLTQAYQRRDVPSSARRRRRGPARPPSPPPVPAQRIGSPLVEYRDHPWRVEIVGQPAPEGRGARTEPTSVPPRPHHSPALVINADRRVRLPAPGGPRARVPSRSGRGSEAGCRSKSQFSPGSGARGSPSLTAIGSWPFREQVLENEHQVAA